MATQVNSFADLQKAAAKWFRKPNETDEQYRDRINNDPSMEISIPMTALPQMAREQVEETRFESARPAIPYDDESLEVEKAARDKLVSYWLSPPIPDECFPSSKKDEPND
jgi:hypothetical protein